MSGGERPKPLAGVRACVVVVGDTAASGGRDTSGEVASELLKAAGAELSPKEIVPDEVEVLVAGLRSLISRHDLVVTTGGTGVARRDVTPEATGQVCERLVPGIPEMIRAAGLKKTPHASLSRGLCGVAQQCIVLNLPGSPGGVRDGLTESMPALAHAIELVRGEPPHHFQT